MHQSSRVAPYFSQCDRGFGNQFLFKRSRQSSFQSLGSNSTGILFFEPNIKIFSQRIFLNASIRTFPARVKAEWVLLFVTAGFTLA